MRCPKCNDGKCGVCDTRPLEGGAVRRRRYACECGHRFTTYEMEAETTSQRMLVNLSHQFKRWLKDGPK